MVDGCLKPSPEKMAKRVRAFGSSPDKIRFQHLPAKLGPFLIHGGLLDT